MIWTENWTGSLLIINLEIIDQLSRKHDILYVHRIKLTWNSWQFKFKGIGATEDNLNEISWQTSSSSLSKGRSTFSAPITGHFTSYNIIIHHSSLVVTIASFFLQVIKQTIN